jgi:hypothetical protein
MATHDITLGDIELGGKPYRIDFDSWRGTDIIDFAPRATVPGGTAVLSDLGMFQPLYQTDWRHGFGFHWYSDAMGYMSTTGNIDTRHDGLVMLYTQAVSSDAANWDKRGMTVFNDEVYAWGVGGLRKFNGTVWSDVYTTGQVNHALATGDYLFFAPAGARIQKIDTAGTITDAGLDANATNYRWLILHNGYIYAGKGSAIHFDNSETLGTLQGNSADTNRIVVGVGSNIVLGAIVYNGNLYVRKSDGVWLIGEDRIARRMLDFSSEESAINLRSWAVINGYLVFALRDRILQWNGARVSDITPHKINDEFPYITYGAFNHFVAVGDYLYVLARTNESPSKIDLLSFDGVGWHKLLNIDSTNLGLNGMMGYEAVNNRLWYHVHDTIQGTDTTYYIQFQERSSFPYANFPTSGTHSVISSRIDVGFRRVKKSMDKLTVEARNVSSTTYLKVYFSLDGEDWVHWRDIKENGVIDLKNPGGAITREWNYMQLRFDFVTSNSAQTPILEGLSLSYIMRPVTRMGYNFNIYAVSEYEHGMYKDDRTSQEILDDLKALRNSVSPVSLIDIYGRTHTGYVTAIKEQPVFRQVEGDQVDIEVMYNVNFVSIVGDEDAS